MPLRFAHVQFVPSGTKDGSVNVSEKGSSFSFLVFWWTSADYVIPVDGVLRTLVNCVIYRTNILLINYKLSLIDHVLYDRILITGLD